MARENQGLQIALILMVMLVVVLCVTTYVYYSKSEKSLNDAEAARQQLETARGDLSSANFKVQTLLYMLNGGSKTMEEIEVDLQNIPGAANDAQLETARTKHRANMALFGSDEAIADDAPNRNYEELATYLINELRDRNRQIIELRKSESSLTAEKQQVEKVEADRSQKFAEAQQKAEADKTTVETSFRTLMGEMKTFKDGLETKISQKDNQIAKLIADAKQAEDNLTKQIADLEGKVAGLRVRIESIEDDSFETPDAKIISVNQRLRVCYIDIGSLHGVRRQQTFTVYDHEELRVMPKTEKNPNRPKPVGKGRVEVLDVVDENMSLCRILEEFDSGNIIVPGDLVHTPAWAPNVKIKFAIAGFIDVDGNGTDDRELLEGLILLNNGVIEQQVTTGTRYLIEGELRGSTPGGDVTPEERVAFNKMVGDAQQLGVDRMSPDKLLSYMGWKGDFRAVRLGTGGNAGDIPSSRENTGRNSTGNNAFQRRSPPRGGGGGAF